MHDGEVLEKMFKLAFRFAIPDIIYYDELLDKHGNLESLGLEIHEMDGGLVAKVEEFANQYRKPSRYDLFALVLAQYEKCPLLTGDRQLRIAAKKEHVEVHGTIWLIEEMVKAKIISVDEAQQAFEKMRDKGSRLPWGEIERRIAQWRLT